MTRLAEGSIIQVGVKQIQQNYQLTPQDEKLATDLALFIHESTKVSISAVGGPDKVTRSYNWIPVYVKENGNRNYEIVGSPVVLEACKKAGLTIVNCLQLDHSKEAEKQVEYLYRGLVPNMENHNGNHGNSNGNTDLNLLDLKNLTRNIEVKLMADLKDLLAHYVNSLEAKIDTMIEIVTPPPRPKFYINNRSQDYLFEKLRSVKGFGGKTTPAVIQAIQKKDLFTSERELLQNVPQFWAKSRNAPSANFNKLRNTYEIDYSYPSDQSY